MKVVFSGSGTLYPVHVGALKALEELVGPPEALCGVSGGAIIAAARASGYETADGSLEKLVLGALPGPAGLIDWSWAPWSCYGLIKGDRLLRKFRQIFPATFGETGIPLTVITSDLKTKTFRHYSTEKTPDADLPLAVRKSLSIPFIFRHIDFEVDGGVMDNFPLDIYGRGLDVIGFRIVSTSDPSPVNTFVGYITAVIGAMMEASTREHIDDAVFARTVILKVKGSSTDFNMSLKEATKLLRNGYKMASSQLGPYLLS